MIHDKSEVYKSNISINFLILNCWNIILQCYFQYLFLTLTNFTFIFNYHHYVLVSNLWKHIFYLYCCSHLHQRTIRNFSIDDSCIVSYPAHVIFSSKLDDIHYLHTQGQVLWVRLDIFYFIVFFALLLVRVSEIVYG